MPASMLFSSTNIDATAAGGKNGSAGGKRLSQSNAVEDKTMRLMSGGSATASGGKNEWSKFSMALSKSEIEEDFYSMVGHRPP
ncbi:hypothetical protein ACS0TY_033315 [Phlomoides rotata]